MPLITSHPELIDGVEYPYLGISMAVTPQWRERDLGAMVAVRFTPFRVAEDGTIVPSGVDRAVVYGDAFAAAASDPDVAAFVQSFLESVQAFITAKGL